MSDESISNIFIFLTLWFPTRITVDSKTLLDVIATNCQSNVSMSGSASASLSDHDLVFCVWKLNCRKAPAQTRIFRSYANYDPEKFCEDLNNTNLTAPVSPEGTAAYSAQQPHCVNEQWSVFESVFNEVSDWHAPFIQKRIRGIDNCPWIARNIKVDMWPKDWSNYRCLRNQVTNKLRKANTVITWNLWKTAKMIQRPSGKQFKKIVPGTMTKSSVPTMNIDGKPTSDKKHIANALNTSFTGVVDRLLRSLGHTNR